MRLVSPTCRRPERASNSHNQACVKADTRGLSNNITTANPMRTSRYLRISMVKNCTLPAALADLDAGLIARLPRQFELDGDGGAVGSVEGQGYVDLRQAGPSWGRAGIGDGGGTAGDIDQRRGDGDEQQRVDDAESGAEDGDGFAGTRWGCTVDSDAANMQRGDGAVGAAIQSEESGRPEANLELEGGGRGFAAHDGQGTG